MLCASCTFVFVCLSVCLSVTSVSSVSLQDYLKDTKACLTNDFSRYKRALTSVRQDLPDADSLAQVRRGRGRGKGSTEGEAAFPHIAVLKSLRRTLVAVVLGHAMFLFLTVAVTETDVDVQFSSAARPVFQLLIPIYDDDTTSRSSVSKSLDRSIDGWMDGWVGAVDPSLCSDGTQASTALFYALLDSVFWRGSNGGSVRDDRSISSDM